MVCVVREAEKSHRLLSANWKTKKTGGVIQSKGLRTREATGVSPRAQRPQNKEGRRWVDLAQEYREKENMPFLSPYCLLGHSGD